MNISLNLRNCLGRFQIDLNEKEVEKPISQDTDQPNYQLSVKDGFEEPFTTSIPFENAKPLLDMISKSRIHPITLGLRGLDGVTVELAITDGSSQSTFSWWLEPGPGWGSLGKIESGMVKLARRYYPKKFTVIG